MSAWSKEEIVDGFKALGISAADAETHYSIIGGSYRHALETADVKRSKMRDAVVDGKIDKADRLFHTFVRHPDGMDGYERRQASDYVVDVLRIASVEALIDTYKQIESQSVRGGIFQVLTEKWMSRECRGGATATVTLKCINLSRSGHDNEEMENVSLEFNQVSFPNGSTLTRKEEITGVAGVMYCPQLCNFPGVDKLLFCNNELLLINDTVSARHGCAWSTIEPGVKCMLQNPTVSADVVKKVIYLVPNVKLRNQFVAERIQDEAAAYMKNNAVLLVGYWEEMATLTPSYL